MELMYHLFDAVLIETNLFPIKQARGKHGDKVNAGRHMLAIPREHAHIRYLRLHLLPFNVTFQRQSLEVLLALYHQEKQ